MESVYCKGLECSMAEMSNPTLAELAALFREVADLGHSIRCRYDPVGIDPESDFCTDGCRERATKARAFAEALEGKEVAAWAYENDAECITACESRSVAKICNYPHPPVPLYAF